MINLLFGLLILLWFIFTGLTIYLRLIGKRMPGKERTIIDELIWNYAGFSIAMIVLSSAGTLSYIFAKLIIAVLIGN